MSKLNGETLNIEEMNIEKLKELFPEVDTDGKIDYDKLKQILGNYVDDSDERYRFTWNGKGEALRLSQTPSMGTLRPAKEESKNWDDTENLYIEGDNLEVLKLLQKSYFNKVKIIYIDPPYNTGGDFVYEDNFKDNIQNYKKITGQVDNEGYTTTTNREYSGRYHTDWLNMMYPRLRLARNLLTDDGVIFISIDDHEFHNLKKISDEIFGEYNFIESYIWQSTFRPDNSSSIHRKNAEIVLLYAKNKINIKRLIGTVGQSEGMPSLTKNSMKKSKLKFPKNKVKTFLKDGIYEKGLKSSGYELLDNVSVKNGIIINSFALKGRVIWGQNYLEKELEEGTDIYIKSEGFVPYSKKSSFEILPPNKIIPKSVVKDVLSGRSEVNQLFNKTLFDYPKPVSLLKYLINNITFESKSGIILDFFAGSSTTAHATIDLNGDDNGNRKFIMVQLPESTDETSEAYKAGYDNIAEIGKERIRRAGEKIKEELKEIYDKSTDEERKEMKHPGELDIGFKTFKLDSSNIKEWNPGKYDNVQVAIEDAMTPYVEGRDEEDVVYEMMLKMGLDLTYPVEEYEVNGKIIYSIGFGFLMICLADNIDVSIAQKMIEIKDENSQQQFRTIFRDEGFSSDTNKTNVKETLRSAGLADESFITL